MKIMFITRKESVYEEMHFEGMRPGQHYNAGWLYCTCPLCTMDKKYRAIT